MMQFTKKSTLSEELVKEYFERNERKKQDDKWLKDNRLKVLKAMQDVGKTKEDFGNLRISIGIPDTSKFIEEKVLEYAKLKGVYTSVIKSTLDEDKLMSLIETGDIDLEDLKNYAWEESAGSPRLTIGEVRVDED